ncbi:hypothetical protein [Actinophytocola xanthii]|uniref:Uncharacterized protein n=1 Tax=Actinophytocola xanthii TaxID=1912961 RepID=A0A1Q8C7P7_9PSEU|nr:hypothetical protein [Actinophytocola xanthii]OLF10384.1 hypothetical protein BU204_31790 [Actinophytocola xanthii]
MTEDRSATEPGVENTARDNAKVDNQIGVVEGDAVFHKHETIYQVAGDDSAERKYRVALNHLDGGIPRVAEELIGQALDAGFETTEVAYYYALSVLSHRPVNQLGPPELDKLERAVLTAQRFDPDEWTDALDVVKDQARRALALAEETGTRSGDPDALVDIQAVPWARQEEIFRHLDMLRDGITQDQIDRLNAQNVAAGRLKDNRTERAWKYFHSDPTRPQPASPIPLEHGRVRSVARIRAVLGAAGAVLALGASVATADGVGFLVLPVVLVLLGATMAVLFASVVYTPGIRRRMKADHDDLPKPLNRYDRSYKALPEPYKRANEIRRRIGYYFSSGYISLRYFSPDRPATLNTEKWRADTAETQAALYARLVRLYAYRAVPPPTLNWLIRWHARQTFERWRADTLVDPGTTLRPEKSAVLGLACGWAVAGIGAIVLVDAARRVAPAPTALSIVALVAGCVACVNLATALAHRRAMAREHVELDQLFADELREYERWRERLCDRPTDIEMATWLENDKNYLKSRAITQCRLNNRDVIAHIVLTEGKRRAKRARVANGPFRYAEYVVLVFLLTENGVREVEFDLDFETGTIYHERRTSFGYDALASVNVIEFGYTSDKEGQEHIVYRGSEVLRTDRRSLVLRRLLRLSLVHQQDIEIVVNNVDGELGESADEDQSYLDKVELDASGVMVALHILEAIAAEGRKWVAWERDLRERRWRDWQRSRMSREALPPAAEHLRIEASKRS